MLEAIGRFDHARGDYCIVPLCQKEIQDKGFYTFVMTALQKPAHKNAGDSRNDVVFPLKPAKTPEP